MTLPLMSLDVWELIDPDDRLTRRSHPMASIPTDPVE
jgi:hypothetical protein